MVAVQVVVCNTGCFCKHPGAAATVLTGKRPRLSCTPDPNCLFPRLLSHASTHTITHTINSHHYCVLHPNVQLMHVLVAAAMWQMHLGATADYRTVSGLLDSSTQCAA